MKKTVLTILMIFLVLVMGMTYVNAESGSARLSASKSTVKKGDTVTVTVSFSPAVTSADFSVSYNDAVMQFVSGGAGAVAVQDDGNSVRTVYMSYTADGISRMTYSFKAIADGTANFGISVVSASGGADDDALAMSCSGTSVTVNTPATPPPTQQPQPTQPTVTTPSFISDNSTVYSTASVNVRSSCTTETSSNIIGSLTRGAAITRTGISDEWDRVNYNGVTAYVKRGYLSTEEPDEDDPEPEEPEDPTTPEEPTQKPPVEPTEKTKTSYDKIVEEQLPKVGEIIEKVKQINKDYKGETKDGVITRYEKEKTQLITIICVETIMITILIIFVTYMNSADADIDVEKDRDKKKKKKKSVSGKRTKKNTIKYKGR